MFLRARVASVYGLHVPLYVRVTGRRADRASSNYHDTQQFLTMKSIDNLRLSTAQLQSADGLYI